MPFGQEKHEVEFRVAVIMTYVCQILMVDMIDMCQYGA